MGRPSELGFYKDRILEGVRLGLTYDRAAALAGVSGKTFYRWKVRGRDEKRGKFHDFFQELLQAEIEGELFKLKLIRDAAKGGKVVTESKITVSPDGGVETTTIKKRLAPQWQAAAWLLERRFPKLYAKAQLLLEEDGPPEPFEIRILPPDQPVLFPDDPAAPPALPTPAEEAE